LKNARTPGPPASLTAQRAIVIRGRASRAVPNGMFFPILPQAANSNLGGRVQQRGQIWSVLLSALYTVYWFCVGILLLWLPWTAIWENNYVLYLYPQLRAVVSNPYVKGGVFGLGIVNLSLGSQEILHVLKRLHPAHSK